MSEKNHCPSCGQVLVVKYIEDRDRLFCAHCRRPVYENPIPATAALVFNESGDLLLVKRKAEPKIGQWCLPGGFLELYETPEACCLRELREETHLTGRIDRLVGVHLSENPIYKSVVVVGYSIRDVKGVPEPGDDSADVRYWERSELPPIAFESHRLLVQQELTFRHGGSPAFEGYTRRKDWGAYLISSGDHLAMVTAACRAGARIVQYRDKHVDKGELVSLGEKMRGITRETGALFIMNDHVDVALAVHADGVHLGQEDMPLVAARRIVPPGFIIGVSTHSLEQALEAESQGAEYIAIGPVYATPTKVDYEPVGLDMVEKVVHRVRVPVVAIGGLTLRNIPVLKGLGVKNVAMVRGYQGDTAAAVKKINRLFLGSR